MKISFLKSYVSMQPGVNLIKLFYHNFTYSFSLAISFHSYATNIAYAIKWSSLQKVRVNLRQKSFMRSAPGFKN